MSGTLPQLGLVGVLVLVNAAFAGTEMALVTLRESQVRRLEEQSGAGRALARLARDPNRFLSTIQIGITFAGFLASAAAAVSLAEPLEEPLAFLGRLAGPGSVVVVTVALSYLTLVLGELAPKRIAMQRAERWALLTARPLALMAAAARPVVWFLSASTDIVVRLFGGDPARRQSDVTEEELRDMVATNISFTPQQRLVIEGAFEVSQRTLQEVLRPRPDVFVVAAEARADEARDALARSGHSRAPVAPGRNLDDVIGVVHLRDLLDGGGSRVGDLAREVPVYPESAAVLATLHEMQRQRAQLAVVVDEHGAAAGIVTVEDLVEEIVGEIYDESDRDVIGVRHDADGSVVVSGRFPVHDLPDLGVVGVPPGRYATVAGLVLASLGHLPERPGEVVEVGGRSLEVLRIRRHAIAEVRIHAPREGVAAAERAPDQGAEGSGDGR